MALDTFQGKVAVVTGAASGIGAALSRAFHAAGAKLVLADVEEAPLQKTAAALGPDVLACQTDVRHPAALQNLAAQTYAKHGACHVLCNNAGVGVPNLNVWETEPNDWEWVHGVNLRGVVHGVQAFVPRMLAGGEAGFVLNTSSGDGGIAPLAEQCVYASSKAAVSIVTECLAAQLAAAGGGGKLRAGILYPAGGMLNTGIWTTKRNRPAELARSAPPPPGSEVRFEEFMAGMKRIGMELPVQNLDELAAHALAGILRGDFVIMIGREGMEAQLVERAQKLARGECPTAVSPAFDFGGGE